MLKLFARTLQRRDADPFVVRITSDYGHMEALRDREGLLLRPDASIFPGGFRIYLAFEGTTFAEHPAEDRLWLLPNELSYLSDGDIVRVNPRRGEFWVMYRRTSNFNSLLLTEQCNSDCVMCSQPPKVADDSHLLQAYLDAIPLMDSVTPELGITGGEPTLLGPRLLALIAACRDALPNTSLHMLSNGRMFSYLSLCRELAALEHPDLMIGIPLYSDIASQHDFVVQADGAFDQTVRGIMNLKRYGLRIEIRVVLHRESVDRLPQLGRFIGRNLPFVDHVALMGLEMMGYVRMNLDALWIDPSAYQDRLVEAVRELIWHKMNVSIYNHQLCVLDRDLWPLARKSISDWKNEYLNCCGECAVRDECGGFFSSSDLRRSTHIKPISAIECAYDSPVANGQFTPT
jgi:His-Xaa-Ser system radical SAM maturase HxsC